MSSSNIIKPDVAAVAGIVPYRFASADHAEPPPNACSTSAFVPFLEILAGDAAADSTRMVDTGPDEQAQEEGNAIQVREDRSPGLSEEELFQRVQEGYDKGFEEGKRQAERGLSNVFRALREAVDELDGLREQVLRESEEDLLKLAIMIARKIINQEIATDRMILAKIVAAAVNSASEREDIVIRLNPEDHRLVAAHKQLYLNGFNDDRLLDLKSDDSVTPGGCIVDTAMGEIDARTDAQLDEIFRRLMEEKKNFPGLPQTLMTEREHYAGEEN
jgi:flagellar assembly protein FliH